MILKILTVIGLASFEIYAAIVTANIFKFDRWLILLLTLIGGIAGTFIAYFLGEKIEHFINEKFRKNKEPKPKKGMLFSIWNKYGVTGVGTIGTFLFGAPAAFGIGVGFNANLKKMLPLCLATVVIRCFIFTFLGDWIRGLF
jgi:membrane protein YqaA with SNARE-associated domain